MARLLWARVNAAHAVIGAPVESFDEFTANTGEWKFYGLGGDGVMGIHLCPDADGDSMIIALPTKSSSGATVQAVRNMMAHMASGRFIYTLAWKGHILAININQRIGGELLGIDNDGFYHFRHTTNSLGRLHRGQQIEARTSSAIGC